MRLSSPPSWRRRNTFAAISKIIEQVTRCPEQHGIAEIWFGDIAGAEAFFGSDGYKKNVIPDEEEFMNRKRCELLYSHEYTVIT
jgi:EthD domain